MYGVCMSMNKDVHVVPAGIGVMPIYDDVRYINAHVTAHMTMNFVIKELNSPIIYRSEENSNDFFTMDSERTERKSKYVVMTNTVFGRMKLFITSCNIKDPFYYDIPNSMEQHVIWPPSDISILGTTGYIFEHLMFTFVTSFDMYRKYDGLLGFFILSHCNYYKSNESRINYVSFANLRQFLNSQVFRSEIVNKNFLHNQCLTFSQK